MLKSLHNFLKKKERFVSKVNIIKIFQKTIVSLYTVKLSKVKRLPKRAEPN